MKPPYVIASVPSLSGHAIAYRWRSLPRVRRHRASKPQGSSERVLPWQITMDQLIFASLSHTHYWYEVGMLKVPSMKWRSLGQMQLLSKTKHSLTTMAQKEVCPRDEIADPPSTAVLPIDRHSFAEGFVSFRTLCGVQSSLVRFAPNRAIAWGPP